MRCVGRRCVEGSDDEVKCAASRCVGVMAVGKG